MPRIKITAKRQATLPAELCDELGVRQGDELEVTRRIENGHPLWVLRPSKKPSRPWLGCLRKFGMKRGTDHSMEAIRNSIARGIGKEK